MLKHRRFSNTSKAFSTRWLSRRMAFSSSGFHRLRFTVAYCKSLVSKAILVEPALQNAIRLRFN